ncbi:hypothetical protein CYMTET_40585 [Cymbomonas tetramitiformis]|uniref:Uncharacterized protein n=1 Tax=Cymbomonas tetramitiformis TaxID=36881 RepID=A0AAE0C7T3_9CHLO|nr:hypothetical protein CYMTET_40585 [Cymbomonas tetramitiformis]
MAAIRWSVAVGIILLGAVMFITGVNIDTTKLKALLNRKTLWGVAAAYCGQAIVNPLSGFLLTAAFDLDTKTRIGAIVIASAPGGGLSNLFTFLSYGNLELSVVATTLSTVTAFATMPVLLKIYTEVVWDADSLDLPYAQIIVGLLVITLPMVLGIAFKIKCPTQAEKVSKYGILSAGFMVVFLVISTVMDPEKLEIFGSIQGKTIGCGIIFCILGFIFGYLISVAFRLNEADRRAICFEICAQNSPLAISIIDMTYGEDAADYIGFVVVYALVSVRSSISSLEFCAELSLPPSLPLSAWLMSGLSLTSVILNQLGFRLSSQVMRL